MSKLKAKRFGYTEIKCPGCGRLISFEDPYSRYLEDCQDTVGAVEVNIESKRRIGVPNMLALVNGCTNAFCKWSKLR